MKKILIILVALTMFGCLHQGRFAGSHATASVHPNIAELGPIGDELGSNQ